MESLYQAVQEACLPAIWSRGVTLARESAVSVTSRSESEIILLVKTPGRPVSPKVSLWPQDAEWFCDCGDRNDPCVHVAAGVVALKNGQFASSIFSITVEYRFLRDEGKLKLERWLVAGGSSARSEKKLVGSLVSYVGGISSGRIAEPMVAATQDDYAVDGLVSLFDEFRFEPWLKIFDRLKEMSSVFLGSQPVKVGQPVKPYKIVVSDEGDGVRLAQHLNPVMGEKFSNGASLCEGVLCSVQVPELPPGAAEWLSGRGRLFLSQEIPHLVGEILPRLESRVEVEVLSKRLPELVRTDPRVVLSIKKEDAVMWVTADIFYGEPPMARVRGEGLELLSVSRSGFADKIPIRDQGAELALNKKVQAELFLKVGQTVRYEGVEAFKFTQKIASVWETRGDTVAIGRAVALKPRLQWQGGSLSVAFDYEAEGGAHPALDFARVWTAFEAGQGLVPIGGGRFAKLPDDWMSRFGSKIRQLLERQKGDQNLPVFFQHQVADLYQDAGENLPESLKKLQSSLLAAQSLPTVELPSELSHLSGVLRDYQKTGVSWLRTLRDSEMGALLADDMGLGKTLQALCAVTGRTLIVAPTSVYFAWKEQAARFRPDLRILSYYGSGRFLEGMKDDSVVLTTYGILRQDREVLAAQDWDMVVLDEAQNIKNPDSQVARAAHSLRAKFRLVLTGTPVENKLEDLWSQFQFLNPGLLGSRQEFSERFESPIMNGNPQAGRELHRAIRPFLLRRLKKDVAPELPSRTETVLYCELSENERDLYDAIQAATRKEVVAALESERAGGKGILAALEALLRLRQASCHPLLVPGQDSIAADTSAKHDLLLEKLQESIDAGHRALVFSQWTSHLDLVERVVEKAGIGFLRLDGSTRDRGEVVSRFQDPGGPPVMLISLKAGGVGVTLTAADHVYILDPWWNPAAEDQAADRAHRIGQQNPVLVHRLIARDTVEERILALQQRKKGLAAAALRGDAGGAAESLHLLTRDEILDLLA